MVTDYYGSREYIGTCLRIARQQQDISIRDLADRTGCSKSTIVNIESGAFSPRLEILQRIANELMIYLPIGAMNSSTRDVITAVQDDLIKVVQQWYIDNWWSRPSDNEDLIAQYRQLTPSNDLNIRHLEDELGEIPTIVLLSYIVDWAIQSMGI